MEGITIANKDKRPDWIELKNEYITTDISQRDMAKKYDVPYATVRRHAETEGWVSLREEYKRDASAKMAQKTAEAAATNAAKLEKAKGLAIDRLLNILERFPQSGGDKVQQYGKDQKGHSIKNQYSLLDIVTALEKLERNSTIDEVDDPLNKLFERMDADVQR